MRIPIASFILVPLVQLGQIATASPVDVRDSVVPKPDAIIDSPATPHPDPKIPPGFSTTTPNTAFSALAATAAGTVFICGARNCAGTCYSTVNPIIGVCYTPVSAFWSGYTSGAIGPTYASTTTSKCGNQYRRFDGPGCTDWYPISAFDFKVTA